jgi:ribbon-helix-helix CopG family protein
MAPLRLTNIRLESELTEGLQRVKERDGISISEQVRRAVQNWLKKKGVKVKTERPRAVTRKRS